MNYVERNCVFTHAGKSYEAGGAIVTPTHIVAYPGNDGVHHQWNNRPMIYLDKTQVPANRRGTYTGDKFKANVCESMTIPADAGLCDGGSREVYHAIRLRDGATITMPGQSAAPWDGARREHVVTLQPGLAVICHAHFCGQDTGLMFYLHPQDAAPDAARCGQVERRGKARAGVHRVQVGLSGQEPVHAAT
jgi:hypothetical protein